MGLTAAATGKSPLELLDPTDEDSVINPANPRTFLTVTLPDGSRISPFQAIRPVARLFLKPAADALGAGYEAYEAREGLRVAAVAFLDAYAKSQASEGKRFMSNRLALPARLILDVAVQNQDYFGRPIVTEDSALGAARQIAAYAGARQLPAFLQPFVEQGPPMVPGTEPTRTQRTIDAALEWAFNLSPSRVPRLPAEVDATLRAEVIRHGGDPGPDPLGAYFDLKLPQDVRARFEADHPEVRRFLQDRTLARDETFNRPRGKDAVYAYDFLATAARVERDERLRTLEQTVREQNLTGNDYRKMRSQIMDDYAGDLRGARRAVFGTPDEDAVQAERAKHGKRDPLSPLDRAVEGWYALRPNGDTPAALDAYFAERRDYLARLAPPLREQLLDTLEQRARAISETEAAYFRAQRVYDEYSQLPTYRGLTVERGREVNTLIARARDQVRYQPGLTVKLAIRMDKTADPDVKRDALRVYGKQSYTNPARRRFFAAHPELAQFYGSIVASNFAELAQRSADATEARRVAARPA